MRNYGAPARFSAIALVFSTLTLSPVDAAPASTNEVPDYLRPIAGITTTSAAETASQNVLALNTAMFDLYGDAGKIFQQNILAQHPVILGLFSGAGGRFILYRPGQPPLEAPAVPLAYQP
ncbi:MAG: hypothetical protein QOF70_6252 [Acetobacteraceae bacterium]|jgi:hypothetical protein|nr:hypothetical protein [Acetobacteraceae bacterium]